MSFGPAINGWQINPGQVQAVTGAVLSEAQTMLGPWSGGAAAGPAGDLQTAIVVPGGRLPGLGKLVPEAVRRVLESQSVQVESIANYVYGGVLGVRACTVEYQNADTAAAAAAQSAMMTTVNTGDFSFFNKYLED